jgi:hypothetical protein
MRTIKEVRRRFLVWLGLLLAISLASAVLLISPVGHASRQGRQRLEQLASELRIKEHDNVPLRGIDQKAISAKHQVIRFYRERFPASYAAISEELGTLAVESNVFVSSRRYRAEPTDLPGLLRIEIDGNVTGNYLQVVKFINSLEREHMFFLIDSVSLGQQQAAGNVELNLQIETYLRPRKQDAAAE